MRDDNTAKIELSYQSIAKTVSDLGSQFRNDIKNNTETVIRLQTIIEGYTQKTDEMLKKHDVSIDSLTKSDAKLEGSISTGKIIITSVIGIIIFLIGTISAVGFYAYSHDLEALNNKIDEKVRTQTN